MPPKGSKVRFVHPNYGDTQDQKIAKKYLIPGLIYIVDHTNVGYYSTDVYLQGFRGIAFNSVMFENVGR